MIELLLGGHEFQTRLEHDLSAARRSVVLQMMSFEGDRAGRGVADALLATDVPDRRVIVDSFTRYMLSCRFRFSPTRLFDRRFGEELARTRAMFGRMRHAGIDLRYCNPAGLLLRRLPARNHKKSVVIDRRVAYIGGINISDHNYEWHDLMVRVEDPRIARVLANDFDDTWQGRSVRRYGESRGNEVHVLDGRNNARGFDRLFQLMDAAQREIIVHSPYLSFPFCAPLERAAGRGVALTVITPTDNTVPGLRRYISWQGTRSGFDVRLFPGMTHLKAMLIDRRWLIVGSSNFDYLSYRRHQEIVMIVRDPLAIDAFQRRVLDPDLAASARAESPTSLAGGAALRAALWGAGAIAALISG